MHPDSTKKDDDPFMNRDMRLDEAGAIVWVDYGSEGWQHWRFSDAAEAQRWVASEGTSHPCVITGPVVWPPKAQS